MLHQLGKCSLDEKTRELRSGDRAIPMQPRVFDLLVYLARNKDRVVPKDELLDAVWPGVIVTDASLQRAVSLARAALAEAGTEGAIRTHARQGYRLCCGPTKPGNGEPCAPSEALTQAREAYERSDWEGCLKAFRALDSIEDLTTQDLQRWAHAAQCAGQPNVVVEPLEKAVALYTQLGDRRRAAWVAIQLGQLRLEWRDHVLAQGWYLRATRLLESEGDCRERGYLDLLGARMGLHGDLEECLRLSESARQAGVRFNDPDLESLGLVHIGEAALYLGRVKQALAALDEAGISVVASGLSPWAGGLVYCGVIFTCLMRADWQRAGQWSEQFSRWCADKGVAGYPGLCRLHRAEVLTVRGDLKLAEEEARATIEMLARQAPWAEGDAWTALGDILLARGTLDAAREAYVHANELGWDSQFGQALVRFATGDAKGAANLLGRALKENTWSTRTKRGQALAHFAIIATADGQLEDARSALAELDQNSDLASTPALQAFVSRARGELAAAEGDRAAALVHFRAALRTWIEQEAPIAAAQTRCRIADLLAAEGDLESAQMERAAAESVFRSAGAEGLLRECRAADKPNKQKRGK